MNFFSRLFFVPNCPSCAAPIEGEGVFCGECAQACSALPPPWCPRCGIPVICEGPCARCLREPPPFRGALSALPYEGPVMAAVRRGKYGPVPWIFGRLGTLLAPLLEAVGPAVVVPMPVTPAAWRARGFSPARQLAAAACRGLDRRDFPLRELLRRTRDAPAQAFLPMEERRRLSPDEFAQTHPASGARVILVDDVVTTGATVSAATRSLRDASEVWVVSLCRTL
jgi:predicted amidophosphoribosyltransferase